MSGTGTGVDSSKNPKNVITNLANNAANPTVNSTVGNINLNVVQAEASANLSAKTEIEKTQNNVIEAEKKIKETAPIAAQTVLKDVSEEELKKIREEDPDTYMGYGVAICKFVALTAGSIVGQVTGYHFSPAALLAENLKDGNDNKVSPEGLKTIGKPEGIDKVVIDYSEDSGLSIEGCTGKVKGDTVHIPASMYYAMQVEYGLSAEQAKNVCAQMAVQYEGKSWSGLAIDWGIKELQGMVDGVSQMVNETLADWTGITNKQGEFSVKGFIEKKFESCGQQFTDWIKGATGVDLNSTLGLQEPEVSPT